FYFDHRPPPTSTPFPYTTLFRSQSPVPARMVEGQRAVEREPAGACASERECRCPQGERKLHAVFRVPKAVRDVHSEQGRDHDGRDRKSTRLNSSHDQISYAVFCL